MAGRDGGPHLINGACRAARPGADDAASTHPKGARRAFPRDTLKAPCPSAVGKHAFLPFAGETLKRVLDRVQPDVVLAPAPQDFHADHHTLRVIALRLMAGRGEQRRLRCWVVHGNLEWPLPKGLNTTLALSRPPLAPHLPWRRVPPSPENRRVKLRAINTCHSQVNVLGRFMRAFVRTNDLRSPEPLPVGRPTTP